MRGWMVAGMTAAVLALPGCADPEPADLIRAEWPAYSGTYEVRTFDGGVVPSVHRETIEFSDADHWRSEGERDRTGLRSQVGDRYCEEQADEVVRCEDVEDPLAPSFWLHQGWHRSITGDVAERWRVEQDGDTHVARLLVERACRLTVNPACDDADRVVTNEYVVRFDRHGIPHHWYETVEGEKTYEAEFVHLVVDGDLVIDDQ